MGYFLATMLLLASLAPAPTTPENPWNGTWVLDASRSTPGVKDQAADAYRFTLQPDGQIKWEIPSLGEVVTGTTDGVPMEIHRTKPSPGLNLSVTAEGREVLIYKVARNGKPQGEGRMTLVENGKAWVDISWPAGQPQYAGEVVYVKQ
jgi:ABC-type glycerol-3-phosphate transport system substrate-binding protein